MANRSKETANPVKANPVRPKATKPRRGLGRGLDALLGSEPSPSSAPGPARTLPLDRLRPNRFQPRTRFEEQGLEDLAASIREQGLVQPLVVTPGPGDRYTIVAGERRWRAASRAGLDEVPVVVREVEGDQQLLEMALVENVQRADLDAIEEAEAYRTLADQFSLSQEDIARRVGKARSTVTNLLRLLRLPREIQDLLRDGRLTAGQARPLLAVQDSERQLKLAEQPAEEGLTARDLERLAAEDSRARRAGPSRAAAEPDVHTRRAAEKLTQTFQTRVDIRRRGRGGAIRLHFHSEEELIRLYDRLMGNT